MIVYKDKNGDEKKRGMVGYIPIPREEESDFTATLDFDEPVEMAYLRSLKM